MLISHARSNGKFRCLAKYDLKIRSAIARLAICSWIDTTFCKRLTCVVIMLRFWMCRLLHREAQLTVSKVHPINLNAVCSKIYIFFYHAWIHWNSYKLKFNRYNSFELDITSWFSRLKGKILVNNLPEFCMWKADILHASGITVYANQKQEWAVKIGKKTVLWKSL